MQGIRTSIIIVFLLGTFKSYSCKCAYYSFRHQCKVASDIFVGRVVKITDLAQNGVGTTPVKVTIVIEHLWKGTLNDTINFTFSNYLCDDNHFSVDQKFVVYSNKNHVDFCFGRTTLLSTTQDIRKLNAKYRDKRFRRRFE